MHTVHIIASEGTELEGAQIAAEEGIHGYGEGRTWDWYEVGGRWDGLIGATGTTDEDWLPGVNHLCYTENPELFNETINTAISHRCADALSALQAIRGDVVTADKAPKSAMGISITDAEFYAKRLSANNAEVKTEWDKLLACQTEEDILQLETMFSPAFYTVYKLMEIMLGHYSFDSKFYDVEAGSTRRAYVDERKGKDPDKQWITVFDLHN